MRSINYYQKKYRCLANDFKQIAGEEKTFIYRDLALGYQVIPAGTSVQQNIPILFIHGWGSSAIAWYFQAMDRVLAERNIYLVTFPGHGNMADYQSINDVTMEKQTKMLASFIREVIGTKPHIVGASFGALIANDLTVMGMVEKTVYASPMIHAVKLPQKIPQFLKYAIQRNSFFYRVVNRIVRNIFTLNPWVKSLGEVESPLNTCITTINLTDLYNTKKNAFWGTLLNLMLDGNEGRFRNLGENEFILATKNDITIKKGYYESFAGHPRLILLELGGHCTMQTMAAKFNRILATILDDSFVSIEEVGRKKLS
jgi:pimeloyl-ACP methyl ester carboxylesterase